MWQEAELIQAILAKWPAEVDDYTAVLDLSTREPSVREDLAREPEIREYSRNLIGLADALRNRLDNIHGSPDEESSIRMLVRDTDPLFRLRGAAAGAVTSADSTESEETEHLVLDAERIEQTLLNRALKRVDFFRDLSAELRMNVVEKLVLTQFAAGDFLLRQGDRADGLLVLLEGTAKVVVAENDRIHNLARLDRRTVIGEMGMVTKAKRTASVVAETSGWAATLTRRDFEALASDNMLLTASLSELISQRLGKVSVDALCGKAIDRYEIRQRLGRGGMGIVYLAIDRETARPVALKMLPHDQALDLLSSRRFRQEAEIVRDLSHPNIVKVFREFSAFGTTFIAMELCDGPSLSDVIKRTGPLPSCIVRKIIGQVAAALLHTHAAGIAHRDLKPSNVLLTSAGEAKLADFGLARSITKSDSGLTQIGEMMGTPRYMAPEQIDGKRGDQQSDLFALGCIAYELWTGKPIFQATMWRELLREQARFEMPPRESLNPPMDASMYALLKDTLRENPSERNVDLFAIAQWAAPVDWSDHREIAAMFTTELDVE